MKMTRRLAIIITLFAALAACNKPPARMAYDSIDGATIAVQTALRGFNVLYQSHMATEDDRTVARGVYETFQKVAISASYVAETVTTIAEAQAAIKQVSDAALVAVSQLDQLSATVKARAPGGVK